MRLVAEYTLTFMKPAEALKWPIGFNEEPYELSIPAPDSDGRSCATGSVVVDTANLTLRECPTPRNAPALFEISVPEARDLANWIEDCTHLLTFATDIPIRRSVLPDRLEAETDADRAILEEFGTDRPARDIYAVPLVKTFSLSTIDSEQFRVLMSRSAGLHLYSHAILVQDDVAAFRDYWRVLESAFGAQNDRLIALLAEFRPAKELKFDEVELRGLLVLRGRLSHAKTRVGASELRAARREGSDQLPRLKCLAEQVLVSKVTWGTKGLKAKRITPLRGFVMPQRGITLVSREAPDGPN